MQTLEINNLNTNTLLTLLKDGEEVILLNDGQEFAKKTYHTDITETPKVPLSAFIEEFRTNYVKEFLSMDEILELLDRKMKQIIMDTSVMATLLLNQPKIDDAMKLIKTIEADNWQICVPTLFIDELLNALLKAENRNNIAKGALDYFWENLQTLQWNLQLYAINYDELSIKQRIALARKHNLRSYDVIYLQLAIKLNAALATFDDRLIRAAKNEQCYFELG